MLVILQNTTSSQMCHDMPEWGRIRLATFGWFRSDCGTMWLVYMGLIKPVSYIHNQANTQFTHLWHICHKKLTHCAKWPAECYALYVTRTSGHLKHFNTKEIHFQNKWQVAIYCNRIHDVHWAMSLIMQKIDNCHNANFVITGTASCHHNDNLQRPRWWQRWRHDAQSSVQCHTKYLTNVLW